MLISIIVPVYNEEKYLPKCIESILNQTYKNLELILVDDGSTDTCPDIIKKYSQIDKRIIFLSEKNSGAGIARNLGLEYAKGEYVTFVDCDDWIDEKCLEVLLDGAKKYVDKNLDAIIWGFHTYDGKESKIASKIESKYYDTGKEFFYRYLIGQVGGGAGINPCKLFRREFLQKNNLQYRKYRRAQDGLFNCETRLFFNSVLTVPYYGYYYRIEQAFAHEKFWSRKDCKFYRDVISCVGMNIKFTREGLVKYKINERDALKAFAEFQLYELNIMGKRIAYDGLRIREQFLLNKRLLEKYTDNNMIENLYYIGLKWAWLDYIIKKKSGIGLFLWIHIFTELSKETWMGRIMRGFVKIFPANTKRGKIIRRVYNIKKTRR